MRKNKFTAKDSSLAFILSIIVPNVLAFLIMFVVGSAISLQTFQETTFYKIMATTLSQISFILILIFIFTKNKISIKAIKVQKNSFKNWFIVVLISLICLLLISPLINVYDSFLISLGITEQTLPISLDNPSNLIYLIFTLGILAPICEELVFRGIVTSGLKEQGEVKAVLISALMFMLMHLSLHQTIYQFVLGAILGFIYVYTNNIIFPILVHFINNTSVLLINYFIPSFFDYKFLSSNYIILAIVLFLVGLFFVYELIKCLKGNKENIVKKPVIQEEKKPNIVLISVLIGIIMWGLNIILSI